VEYNTVKGRLLGGGGRQARSLKGYILESAGEKMIDDREKSRKNSSLGAGHQDGAEDGNLVAASNDRNRTIIEDREKNGKSGG